MPIQHVIQVDSTLGNDYHYWLMRDDVLREVHRTLASCGVGLEWEFLWDSTVSAYPSTRTEWTQSQLLGLYNLTKTHPDFPYYLAVVSDFLDTTGGPEITPGITFLETPRPSPGQIPSLKMSFIFYEQLNVNAQIGTPNESWDWVYGTVAHELAHQRASLIHLDSAGGWIYHTMCGARDSCLMQSAPSLFVHQTRRFCISGNCFGDTASDSSCYRYLQRTNQ